MGSLLLNMTSEDCCIPLNISLYFGGRVCWAFTDKEVLTNFVQLRFFNAQLHHFPFPAPFETCPGCACSSDITRSSSYSLYSHLIQQTKKRECANTALFFHCGVRRDIKSGLAYKSLFLFQICRRVENCVLDLQSCFCKPFQAMMVENRRAGRGK